MLYASGIKYLEGFMSKPNTKYIDKYNEREYARYTIRIRKDSTLYDDIEKFMAMEQTSLNYLVTKLLKEHFNRLDADE
jgi:hypothetical protein